MLKNLRKKKISESGITLVALVVTIIVLLILAAISISMVLGNSGLIKRTADASNTWEKAIAEEEEMLETLSAQVEELTQYVEHGGGGSGGGTNKTITISSGGGTTPITLTGNTEELKDHYGDTVTSFSSIQGMEWQLAYDDTDYYYVIAADYINTHPSGMYQCDFSEYETYPDKLAFAQYTGGWGATATYTGTIFSDSRWSGGINSGVFTTNGTFSKWFADRYLKWIKGNDLAQGQADMKVVAYMLDPDVWSDYAGDEPGAYAMGGPTLELFVKSWNAAHDNNHQIMSYDTLNSSNSDYFGYLLSGFGTNQTEEEFSIYTGDLGDTSNMWSKVGSYYDMPMAMWLASPVGYYSDEALLYQVGGGAITTGYFFEGSQGESNVYLANGIRPVVAIPKSANS